MNTWLQLLVALCGAEFAHNSFEIWSINKKLNWLDLTWTGMDYGKWPLHINNRYKWASLHLSMLFLFTGFFYLILKLISLNDTTLIILGIIVVIANYVCTTCFLNRYHRHIGKMIKSSKKA